MRPDMQMKKKVSQNHLIPISIDRTFGMGKSSSSPTPECDVLTVIHVQQSLPATATAAPDPNGMNLQAHDPTTAAALAAVRRASQQNPSNGHTDSPVSRTGTPNMYDPNLAAFHQDLNHFPADPLQQYPLPGGSPRAASPMNGDQQQQSELPQTHEQLIAANSSLKTRVSELDLINELYRGRLTQLEQDQANADNLRHEAAQERMQREEIQRQLEDSHRRENMFKRRLDEMEQENQDLKNKLADLEFERPAKRLKFAESDDVKTADEKQQVADMPEMSEVSDEAKIEETMPETKADVSMMSENTKMEDVVADAGAVDDAKPEDTDEKTEENAAAALEAVVAAT